MKKAPLVALVGAGRVSHSFLARLPGLSEHLGPVVAPAYRFASRVVNTIGAGYPAQGWTDLDAVRIILILAPDAQLAVTLDGLAASGLSFANKTIVLCGSEKDSRVLARFAEAGASVASFDPMDGYNEQRFVAEGNREAIRQLRRILPRTIRIVEIARGQKALYLAGVSFATSLSLPLIAASVEALRAARLQPAEALSLAERLFQKTLRAYLKAGKKGWGGALACQEEEAIRRQVEALFGANPLLASYFYENAVVALELFRRDPHWVRRIAPNHRTRAAMNVISSP